MLQNHKWSGVCCAGKWENVCELAVKRIQNDVKD